MTKWRHVPGTHNATESWLGRGWGSDALVFVIATVIYMGAARLGLSLAFLHANVSPVWPPTGVALAGILLLGYRVAPSIFLGAFLANLATHVSVGTAGGIAIGNTLEAVIAAHLLQQFTQDRDYFSRVRNVLGLVVIAGLLSPILSATIGTLTLCLGGAAEWVKYGSLWVTWWLGDGAGALVLAPLFLTWIGKDERPWTPPRLLEAASLLAALTVVACVVFGGFFHRVAAYPLGHLTIPFLLWAAIRFGPRTVATAVTVLSGIAIWGTTRGLGPFVEGDLNQSLILLQVFVVAITVTALVLAAVVIEYQRARDTIAFLASIVESTDDAVIGKTMDGAIMSWNKGAEKLYGYEAGEVIGKPFSLLVSAGDSLGLLEADSQEVLCVRRNGSTVHTSLTISPITDALGAVVGKSAIARDITARKQAEEALRASEDRLRAIVDNSSAFIYLKDRDGRYLLMNNRCLAAFGFRWEQVRGKLDSEIYPPEMATSYTETDRKIMESGEAVQLEETGLEADGRHTYLTVKFPLRDAGGSIYALCGIATDITELKKADELYRALLVREHTAREAAEAANRAKDEFVALVSHELRSPVSSMMGWAEMMLNPEINEDTLKQGLQVIARNARLQARLVDDLLDMSRIVTGKFSLDMESTELAAALRNALDVMNPEAESKNISLQAVIDPDIGDIEGDGHRLQQCFSNLISNAIKFTPGGGKVEVRLERVDSFAQITVKDTGTGILPEFLPFVFERLRQGDSSSSRGQNGLGLGLYIVRHIIELHGGTVTAESDGVGQGATFTVRLPLSPAPQTASEIETVVRH